MFFVFFFKSFNNFIQNTERNKHPQEWPIFIATIFLLKNIKFKHHIFDTVLKNYSRVTSRLIKKFSIYNIRHDSNCPNLTWWVCWSSLCPSAGFVCLGGPFAVQSGCPAVHGVVTELQSGPAASQTLCRDWNDLKFHLDQNWSKGPGNAHILPWEPQRSFTFSISAFSLSFNCCCSSSTCLKKYI